MSERWSRKVLWIISALVSAYSTAGGLHDPTDVFELLNKPSQYDQRKLVVHGVLALTSEGYFLFPNCAEKKVANIQAAIAIPHIDSGELIRIDAIGSFVNIFAKFVARDERKINSRHRLVEVGNIGKTTNTLCAD